VTYKLVAPRRPNRAMALLHEKYAPGADTGADMLRHEGEEGGVIVGGHIELTVGAETRQLGPGDAYYFTSAIPHRFRNTSAEPCEIVSANTPPTF
jgi:mannose-6-phosphate isomerase-like protein (cupin superfamily)